MQSPVYYVSVVIRWLDREESGTGGGGMDQGGGKKRRQERVSHTHTHTHVGSFRLRRGGFRLAFFIPHVSGRRQSTEYPCKNIDGKRKSPAELNRECSRDSRKRNAYTCPFVSYADPVILSRNSFLKSLFL